MAPAPTRDADDPCSKPHPPSTHRSTTEIARGLTLGLSGAAAGERSEVEVGEAGAAVPDPSAAAALAPHALLGHRELAAAACYSSTSAVAASLGARGEMVAAWELVRVERRWRPT
uniref:Uncharacterized protein n=1 Tax=Arundo donax TaxID=35708 RepID=A0A0A9BXI0_ARUDO